MGFDWKATLRTVAPALGTALGGPMIGLAVKTVSDTLLGRPDGSEAEIAAAMQGATPDQLLALKAADYEFQRAMAELEVDLERVAQQDRSSARDMASKTTILPQGILSLFYIGGYFILLYLFATGEITVQHDLKTEFNMLLGMLSAPMIAIINFWFGSSAGSAKKTEFLKEAASGRR